LPTDSIALEDVDVYNVPRDLDIIIDPKIKKMVMVGQKMNNDNHDDKEQEANIFKVEKQIFEEKSFDEYKSENLFEFEK
jgi:hypothetical protein